ncbi:MAG: tyrosine-type recombinase/integrase [Oceanicaulis sp.]
MTQAETFKLGPLTVRPYRKSGKATGQWHIDIPPLLTRSGKRKRVLADSRKDAEARARVILREIQARGGFGELTPEYVDLTLSELVADWLDYQESRVELGKKRRSTVVTNIYQLKPVLAFLGARAAKTLKPWDLEEYQSHRLRQGRKARSINSEIATLGQALRWGHERGLIGPPPTCDSVPADSEEKVVATPEEVVAVLDSLREPARSLALFIATTGCRWSEAAQLRWIDVDEIKGIALVTPHQKRKLKTAQSKRAIPLPTETLATLRKLPKTHEWVFPSPKTGEPYTALKKTLARASARQKLSRNGEPFVITAQVLRRSFATWRAAAGIPPFVLQKILGHSPGSRVTAKFYTLAQDAHVRAAMEGFSLKPKPKIEAPNDRPLKVRKRQRTRRD